MIITDLIYYDLKVAALIAVFYLFYQLLLSRETTHALNRVVLLSGIGLSLVLPLCIITLHRTVVVESGIYPMFDGLAVEDATALPVVEAMEQSLDWTTPLAVVLLAGTIIRLLFVAQSYRKLKVLMRSGEMHTLPTGTRVCVVDAPVAPFSWMQTVVLSRADWQLPTTSILAHEEAHVRHRHSYDVVVVEVLTALQWFNPVVWFLRQELRTLHEYEADASVLSRGFDESQYIHLLMQKATGIQACALANGINTHKTKKRIMMMLKPKSKRSAWLKALYIVPVVLVSLTMTAKTVIDYETLEADDNAAVRVFKEKTNGRGESYQIRHAAGVKFYNNGKEETIPDDRPIALEVKKTTMQLDGVKFDERSLPDLPISALQEIHLDKTSPDHFVCRLVTAEATNVGTEPMPVRKYSPKMSDTEFALYIKQQQAAGIDEKELEQIMLNEAGSISRAHILHIIRAYGSNKNKLFIVDGKEVSREEFNKIKPEAIASVTVMDVGPAKKAFGEKGRYGATVVETKGKTIYIVDGKQVSQEKENSIPQENIMNIDVISNKELCSKYGPDVTGVVMIRTKQSDEPVFDICEQLPHFPGGDAKLMEFIARNVKYPEIATENDMQGRVIVRFIVEKDGSLTNPEVLATSPGIGEAIPIEVTSYKTEKERQDAEDHNAGVQALRDEALRVVKAMPKWIPGKQNGEVVRCYYSVPLTFKLE